MYTNPMPRASEAAHAALKVSGVSPPPGVNCHQASSAPSMSREAPAGDQLNECTALASKSSRGNPRSSTIHSPAGEPSGPPVAQAIHWSEAASAPLGGGPTAYL